MTTESVNSSALQKAARVIESLQRRLAREKEPIAIIGTGCKLPGGIQSLDSLHRLLCMGEETRTEVPADRWDIADYYNPDPTAAGKIYTRHGHFLNDVHGFDAAFFGIPPREATGMDPQQRLLLQVSWAALEDAGLIPEHLRGSQTGLFLGMGQNDYAQLKLHRGKSEDINAYDGSGNGFCFASGRLSHSFGFRGPNLAVDTACSSSLVAIHLACRALRAGECDLALAGGSQLVLHPDITVFLSRAQALSADGRCKVFDQSADGYARGEGIGVVVLKRLKDALRDGDRILAQLEASAIGHDGHAPGLTVPSGEAQTQLVRKALKEAGLRPDDIDYVETHGTGTALGDPIEVKALGSVFSNRKAPLMLGSIKANIGHLEAAAGVAGLLKLVAALVHKELPPQRNFKNPSTHIPWQDLDVSVPTEITPWPRSERPRRAGLSSFGIAGSIAHLIVSEPPVRATKSIGLQLQLLTISAKTPKALDRKRTQYAATLAQMTPEQQSRFYYTAAVCRTHHPYRLAVLSSENLHQDLNANLEKVNAVPASLPHSLFLFTGQGSQYAGMGQELYESQPVFRDVLDRCHQAFDEEGYGNLLDILFGPQSQRIHETTFAQPLIYTVECGLHALWQAWGITPNQVLGHSVGEFAAAHAAGLFSLEDGLRLVAARGKLMGELSESGGMAVVAAHVDQISPMLAEHRDTMSIAAINGPRNLVISGSTPVLDNLLKDITAMGIVCRKLQVSHAFHSPLMKPMLAAFAEIANQLNYKKLCCDWLSCLNGKRLTDDEDWPTYWTRHVSSPVIFQETITRSKVNNSNFVLELGPNPILVGMGRKCVPHHSGFWSTSMRQGQSEQKVMLESLAAYYNLGGAVDWKGFYGSDQPAPISLPNYPFENTPYWVETPDRSKRSKVLALIESGDRQGLVTLLRNRGVSGDQQERFENLVDALMKEDSDPVHAAYYQTEWIKTSLPLKPKDGPSSPWLILANEDGFAQDLGEILRKRGSKVAYLSRTDGGHLRNDLKEMLSSLGPDAGIVHSWTLDASTEDLNVHEDCVSLMHAVQALHSLGAGRCWFLSRNGVTFDGQEPNLSAAAPWGMGKALALEMPQHWGGLIDLGRDAATSDDVATIGNLLCGTEQENMVVLRNGERYVARLTPASRVNESDLPNPLTGSWLITGGTGALGLHVASFLANRGAEQLVLCARNKPKAATLETIEALKETGAQVYLEQLDVSNELQMAALFKRFSRDLQPLKGIIHAAGSVALTPFTDLDEDDLKQALDAKVTGSLVLHRLAHDHEPDHFVCFSSIASAWGSKEQAAYAAANHFMDGFTQWRVAQGLPCLSVNWGPWSGGGMADDQSLAQLSGMGITALNPQQNLSALESLMASNRQGVIVAACVDWARFVPLMCARSTVPLLEKMVPTILGPETKTTRNSWLEKWGDMPQQHMKNLIQLLREEVKVLLGLGELPHEESGFFELGFDSFSALDLHNELQKKMGRTLPGTLIFDYPNIRSLAAFLLAEAGLAEEPIPAAIAPPIKNHQNIAIVAMACRFPGGIRSPEAYWKALFEGFDLVGAVPESRWSATAWRHADPQTKGKMITDQGAFLHDVDHFDARFFGIAPKEALAMDPQQRLLLEVSWEAMERASIRPGEAGPRPTGVFVGITGNDYARLSAADEMDLTPWFVSGNALNSSAGRLAYTFGFQGPAMAVDTACSSSLSALHLASQSLRNGEISRALVAGVNLTLTPWTTVATSQAQMISPTGRCHTFDKNANGYVRGEACIAVILMGEAEALAEGYPIAAVIRGSAMNQDGASGGFSVPSGTRQQALIKDALANAAAKPDDIAYVEAHGTGTPLGDPIEMGALAHVFGNSERKEKLLIGSVKTNIGHTEAAAGLAGLLKAVGVLSHRKVPPHLHLKKPNPLIDWRGPLEVPTVPTDLPERAKLVGVSAFGFSGTNAHVILGPSQAIPQTEDNHERDAHLLCLSAWDKEDMDLLIMRHTDFLDEHPDTSIADYCFTMNTGRKLLPYRLAVVAKDLQSLKAQLENRLDCVEVDITGKQAPDIGFEYKASELDSKHLQALYLGHKAFKEAWDEAAEILRQRGYDLTGKPLPDQKLAQQVALSHALTQLWLSWGIQPFAITAEGTGVFSGLLAAGILDLDTCLELALSYRPDTLKALTKRAELILPKQPRYPLQIAGIKSIKPDQPSWWTKLFSSQPREESPTEAQLTLDLCRNTGILKDGQEVLAGDVVNGGVMGAMARVLSQLFIKGMDLNLKVFGGDHHRKRLVLPTYPFRGTSFWPKLDSRKPNENKDIPLQNSYETVWQESQGHISKLPCDTVLLLGDQVCDAQFDFGDLKCFRVRSGVSFERTTEGWLINPLCPEHYEQLLTELTQHWQGSLCLVHAWSLDKQPGSWEHLDQDEETMHFACRSALYLSKALLTQTRVEHVYLHFLTRGAVASAGPVRDLAGAGLWGFVNVLRREHAELNPVLVDLDPAEADLQSLVFTELGWDGEPRLVFRGGKRKVARIAERTKVTPLPSLDAGPYLITGGMGGLGLEFAKHWAEAGVKELYLMGRHIPDTNKKLEALAGLAAQGVTVHLLRADVSDEAAILKALEGKKPPRGILHAAGVLEDAPISTMDWEHWERVWAPKVIGSLVLHRLSVDWSLDFFVGFSSLATLLGSPGQANYAAANGAMDAVLAMRSELGMAASSIQWGPFAGTGMAADMSDSRRRLMKADGLDELTTVEGVQALQQVGGGHGWITAVCKLDWTTLAEKRGTDPQLKKWLSEPEGQSGPQRGALRIKLLNVFPGERRFHLEQALRTELSQALGHEDTAQFDERLGFFEQGLDSLISMSLLKRLEQLLDIEIGTQLLFDYPSLNVLVDHLLEVVFPSEPSPQKKEVEPTTSDASLEEEAMIAAIAARYQEGFS